MSAASTLLTEEGYGALTYERVADVAGVNKSSIRYNFGSKSALIAAVVDAMVHDECVSLTRSLEDAEESQRAREVAKGIEDMIVHNHGFYDVLPHAFRNPDLRSRIVALYDWWYAENRKWLGLTAQPDTESARDRLGLGASQLLAAIIDGLSIQAHLHPEGFDIGPSMEALVVMLDGALSKLVETDTVAE